jgi:hypothetical protein
MVDALFGNGICYIVRYGFFNGGYFGFFLFLFSRSFRLGPGFTVRCGFRGGSRFLYSHIIGNDIILDGFYRSRLRFGFRFRSRFRCRCRCR